MSCLAGSAQYYRSQVWKETASQRRQEGREAKEKKRREEGRQEVRYEDKKIRR
jgi:hypothetical protein